MLVQLMSEMAVYLKGFLCATVEVKLVAASVQYVNDFIAHI